MNVSDWIVKPGDISLENTVRKLQKREGEHLGILDYQKGNLDLALSYVTEWTTAIDGGANYGLMSFHMHKKFDKIYAYEIDSEVRDCLVQNMQKFGCNNVVIEPYGLGDKDKNVTLKKHSKSFSNHIDETVDTGDTPIRAIDSYGFDRVGFIKLDCEGYEPFILHGAENTIKKFMPVILMERKMLCAKWNFDKHYAQRLLEDWGYKLANDLTKDVIMIKA